MFDWLKRNPKIPEGMLALSEVPIDDEDGLPKWTREIELLTQQIGPEFLRPFLFEISDGQAVGGLVAKGVFKTDVRAYEARAVLIQRTNDEYRATILVSAPAVEGHGAIWPVVQEIEHTVIDDGREAVAFLRRVCQKYHPFSRVSAPLVCRCGCGRTKIISPA